MLMTLHSAKGLEFPVVFLTGLEEGLFPLRRGDDMDHEEERRLCYVGMTRAERYLVLSWARQRMLMGEMRVGSPSRFLRDLPASTVARRLEADPAPVRSFQRRDKQPPRRDVVWDETDFVDSSPDHEADLLLAPAVGSRVVHDDFGEGTVVRVSGFGPRTRLSIDFPARGIRQILASYVRPANA